MHRGQFGSRGNGRHPDYVGGRSDEGQTLEGEKGAIRLRDWAVAERKDAGGQFRPASDPMPIEAARPLVLRRELEGVARMTRGDPHHFATLNEALDARVVGDAILAR